MIDNIITDTYTVRFTIHGEEFLQHEDFICSGGKDAAIELANELYNDNIDDIKINELLNITVYDSELREIYNIDSIDNPKNSIQ